MNNSQRILASYDAINRVFNTLDQSRSEIYNACDKIINQVDATVNWTGPDAERYKQYLKEFSLNAKDYTKNILNEYTWELKCYVEELKRQAEEAANSGIKF